jgi:23S rRNA pseudouridine1911/1915/1917 synthase
MLAILFEDYHLIAVNKPGGLLIQAPPGIPSLEAEVKAYLKDKYSKPAGVYLGIPHRLDRAVSGVALFARNTKAAQRLAKQFHEHAVEKVYWALVEGEMLPKEGEWEDWLLKVPGEARTLIAEPNSPGAKRAVSRFRVLQSLGGGTLLEIRPQTGRTHQIRVQAASRGHPVFGDQLYGAAMPFGPPAELPRDRVIALHGRTLTIVHPFTKQPLSIEAPLPGSWQPTIAPVQ